MMAENFPTQFSNNMRKRGTVPWKSLMLSGMILGATLIVYFGLAFLYTPLIQASIENSKEQIARFDQTAPKAETEAEFIQFYSQLMNISRLLAAYTTVTPFFNTFEANTKPNVGFSAISIDVPERTARMSGFARSYEVLAGQLAVYEGIPDIEKVALLSAKLVDNFVGFEIKTDFSREFFRFTPPIQQPIEQSAEKTQNIPVTPIPNR